MVTLALACLNLDQSVDHQSNKWLFHEISINQLMTPIYCFSFEHQQKDLREAIFFFSYE